MIETQNLANPDNYKILIQQKFNRVKRLKCKYLTPDLMFVEDENKALEFLNFSDAEKFLSSNFSLIQRNPRPRIIIKYKVDKDENLGKKTNK